jgi:DNA repair protein RecO (recombination protein O)
MPAVSTSAFVIKTQDYRETSLLATFFTLEYGKIRAVIKGGRESRYRYQSTLEPFSLNEIMVYLKKRRDLHLVTAVDLTERFETVRRDLETLGTAVYFLELVDQLTETHHPDVKIFELIKSSLFFLTNKPDPQLASRLFEMKLMRVLGFLGSWSNCLRCGNRDFEKKMFSVGSGGMVCTHCRSQEGPLIILNEKTHAFLKALDEKDFEEWKTLKLTHESDKVNRVMRPFVNHHLSYKPRSLVFLEKVACTSKIS